MNFSYSLILVASALLAVGTGEQANIRTPLQVCAVAAQPIGARVLVRAELSRGASSGAATFESSGALCNAQGAGLLWVTFANQKELKKLWNAQPRPRRNNRGQSGDFVTLEGTLKKVEQGRFSTIDDAVVIALEPPRPPG